MPAHSPSRAEAIADAAISVLAAQGARGLTHRAVDSEAGLPPGSTSNVARTKDALFDLLQERLVAREVAGLAGLGEPPPGDRAGVAELVAGFVLRAVSPEGEVLTLARFELFLEARRRPALRESVDGYRATYTTLVARLLDGAGVPGAAEGAPRLVALADGLTVNGVLHRATPLAAEEVRAEIARWLERAGAPTRSRDH